MDFCCFQGHFDYTPERLIRELLKATPTAIFLGVFSFYA